MLWKQCALAAVFVCVFTIHASAQTRADIIRGHITSDSGHAVAGADIIVTMSPGAEVFRQQSDSAGNFRLVIENGTGEYLLFIGGPGRKAFRQRLTRIGGDTTFIANPVLATVVATIATVKVTAAKSRPSRVLGSGSADGNGTSGADKTIDGVNGALPPELQGNLDAMASLFPGLSVGPGGISAFGLSSADNNSTLNGLNFSGDIPRDARTSTRFTLSPWDPTSGAFSGVLAARTFSRGGNIAGRTAHVTLDAPALQYADPVAARTGQTMTNIQLSTGGQGAVTLDESFYNYGAQLSRRTSPTSSLLSVDADALRLSGISPDSAARLLQILSALHVPLSAGGIPSDRTTTSGSFLGRYDHVSQPPPKGAPPGPVWSTSLYASMSKSEAQSLSATSTPSLGGTNTNGSVTLQGLYSTFVGKNGDYINETTSSINYAESRGTPYLQLPSGNVLISSALADGSLGIGSLGFGGGSVNANDSKNWSWEVINQTNWLGGGKATFPLKLYLQSRLEEYSQSPAANRLGSFGFQSLAALAGNQPTSFSRTLNTPDRTGGEWTGAAALGGNWTSKNITLSGGLRADGNVFTASPAENAQVATLFGAHTSNAPNSFDVSPRLGFTWRYTGTQRNSSVNSGLATFWQGGIQLRGGIGKFRSSPQSNLLSDASVYTGLPGGTQQLYCIGTAAPAPNWQAYANNAAAVPIDCIGGSTFADTTPRVRLFDRNYRPSESWRGSLGWTSTLKWAYITVDGTLALNLNQPGSRDLNFAGTPRFTLANEGNRPVFVSASNIAPSTGAVSSVASRTSSLYGSVIDRVSDLRGQAQSLTVYVIPNIPFRSGVIFLNYAYTNATAQARGFDQSTGGDPRTIDWAPVSFTPKHRFVIQMAKSLFKYKLGLTTSMTFASGLPYTPFVSGDINGDGSGNDRAFIFNPAAAPDTAVANGLKSLLASGTSSARRCLQGQLGQVASRNSCVGPWSATMNAQLSWSPALPNKDGRVHVSASILNVLGGADLLLHGSNNLKGWGMNALPDQTLYQVKGFDAANNRFVYQVNSRFGSASPYTTVMRNPLRVTLDITIDIGRSYSVQQLEQNLRMRPALKGTRAPADSLKVRYMESGYADVLGILVRMSDSLALSRKQIDEVEVERKKLNAHADSLYSALATYLASLPDSYDAKEAVKRASDTNNDAWKAIFAERTFLIATLTPGQIRLLPVPLRAMIADPNYTSRFFGF